MRSRALRYRLYRNATMSCFPDGRSAPPTLSYASPQTWTYGAAITPVSPTTTGATSFAVQSGALPTGVSLNATTGDITGTPTTAKVAANVVIRATGPGGTADATINIAVPSPLYTSLVDYWNLDEASGTRVGSHAGLDLTDNNTVTSQATGGPDGGRCAQFTRANSEYLSRSSEAALQTGDIDFTLFGWAYFDSTDNGQVPIGKGDVTGGEYSVLANPSTGLFLTVDDASNLANGGAPGSGAWVFFVAWHNATDNTVNMQLNDGAAVSASEGTVKPVGSNSFMIGIDVVVTGRFLNGRLAYVGMSKRILTSAEKTWLYNSGAGRAYSTLASYDGG